MPNGVEVDEFPRGGVRKQKAFDLSSVCKSREIHGHRRGPKWLHRNAFLLGWIWTVLHFYLLLKLVVGRIFLHNVSAV